MVGRKVIRKRLNAGGFASETVGNLVVLVFVVHGGKVGNVHVEGAYSPNDFLQ